MPSVWLIFVRLGFVICCLSRVGNGNSNKATFNQIYFMFLMQQSYFLISLDSSIIGTLYVPRCTSLFNAIFRGVGNLLGMNRNAGEVDNYQNARYSVVNRFQVTYFVFFSHFLSLSLSLSLSLPLFPLFFLSIYSSSHLPLSLPPISLFYMESFQINYLSMVHSVTSTYVEFAHGNFLILTIFCLFF